MWLYSDVPNGSALAVPVRCPWPADATVAELLQRVGVADPEKAAAAMGFDRVFDFVHAPYLSRVQALRRLPTWEARMKAADAAYRVSAGLLPYKARNGQPAERGTQRALAALTIVGGRFINRTAGACGDVTSATSVLETVYKCGQEWLGETHPTVLYTRTMLLQVYTVSKKIDKAVTHVKGVVAATEKLHHHDLAHPDVALAEFLWANVARQKRDEDHVTLYSRISDGVGACLGKDHHYISRLQYCATMFVHMADKDKAEAFRECYFRWRRELGEGHVATVLGMVMHLGFSATSPDWLAQNTDYALGQLTGAVEALKRELDTGDPIIAVGYYRRALMRRKVFYMTQDRAKGGQIAWERAGERFHEAKDDFERAIDMYSRGGLVDQTLMNMRSWYCELLDKVDPPSVGGEAGLNALREEMEKQWDEVMTIRPPNTEPEFDEALDLMRHEPPSSEQSPHSPEVRPVSGGIPTFTTFTDWSRISRLSGVRCVRGRVGAARMKEFGEQVKELRLRVGPVVLPNRCEGCMRIVRDLRDHVRKTVKALAVKNAFTLGKEVLGALFPKGRMEGGVASRLFQSGVSPTRMRRPDRVRHVCELRPEDVCPAGDDSVVCGVAAILIAAVCVGLDNVKVRLLQGVSRIPLDPAAGDLGPPRVHAWVVLLRNGQTVVIDINGALPDTHYHYFNRALDPPSSASSSATRLYGGCGTSATSVTEDDELELADGVEADPEMDLVQEDDEGDAIVASP